MHLHLHLDVPYPHEAIYLDSTKTISYYNYQRKTFNNSFLIQSILHNLPIQTKINPSHPLHKTPPSSFLAHRTRAFVPPTPSSLPLLSTASPDSRVNHSATPSSAPLGSRASYTRFFPPLRPISSHSRSAACLIPSLLRGLCVVQLDEVKADR
jgi:hypothetical protein